MNNNILKVCPSDSAYKFRPETDVFFRLSDGAFSYSGIIDKAIRHIESIQSMREDLWSVFIKQFSYNPDDDGRWRCEYWGKMMRGACMTYQYTRSDGLYKVLENAVRGLLATQDDLGRIATYSVEAEFNGWDVWGRKYVMLGLEHFMEICRDEVFKKEILTALCRHADYIVSKVGYQEEGKKPLPKCSAHLHGINCCSILEPFVRLYNITGDKNYLDFASYIVDIGAMDGGDMFELICEGKLRPHEMPETKAYETMSCLEGLTEYYRVTKIEKYKHALCDFAKKIATYDTSIIGSCGCTHELFDFSAKRQTVTEYYQVMQETCVTVTWMKLCFQLLCLTGDPFFGDQIEKSVYNAMLSAVNTENRISCFGFAFDSYSPLYMDLRSRFVGGHNAMENGSVHYGCCACIGSAGTALSALSSVLQAKDGLYFNLYIPGYVDVNTPNGSPFKLNIDTKHPADSKITITVKGARGDEEFAIGLRIPAWCKNPSLKVCGENVKVKSGENATLLRKWSCFDTIELDLEMGMELVKAPFGGVEGDRGQGKLVAFRKGPVAFARDRRLGEKLDSIIDVDVNERGYVNATPSSKADFATEQEYTVTMKDGSTVTLIDFQSAGKTWDENSMMTVWCPTENFWSVDEEKPVRFNNLTFLPCVIDEASGLVVSDDEGFENTYWHLEKLSENRYMIRHKSGLYLTGEYDSGKKVHFIYLREKGNENQVWNLNHYAADKYRLCLDGTTLAFVYYYYTNRFMLHDYTKPLVLGANDVPNNAFVVIKNI